MKIRTGFVSNSSSSSFVAWGVYKDDINFSNDYWLDKFNEQLENYESLKNENSESYEKWNKRWHLELLAIESDEDKIDYSKDNLDDDYEFGNNINSGGQENDFVGLTVETVEHHYPNLEFGKVRQFVANKLNEVFGTRFTEKDIKYYEEGWYNG